MAFIAQSEYALGRRHQTYRDRTLTGLVLGDMETGIVMGATLSWRLSVPFAGGTLPPDVVTGGVIFRCAAFCD